MALAQVLFTPDMNRFWLCRLLSQAQVSRPLFLLVGPRLSAVREISSINIEKLADGRGLQIEWHGGGISRFHSRWLRMNCACDLCHQSNSGQRILEASQLPSKIKLAHITLLDDEVTVKWEHEDHKSVYKLYWLKQHSYMTKDIESQSNQRKFHTFKGAIPESLNYEDVAFTNAGLLKFLQLINEHGLALVKGVPSDDNIFRKVAQRVGPIQNTIYGELFDVISTPNPINIAYSSSSLVYHMDLVYYQSPPGIQFLNCHRFDKEVVGGESIFLDVYAVAEQFREKNPTEFDTLVRVPATFQKIHFKRENPVYMKYQRPHITLNHRKEIVAIAWSPPFEGPLFVEEDDVEPYYHAYFAFEKAINQSNLKVKFRLEVGDLIAFNNIRMLHGRNGFELNGGSRFLKGCYVNIDEFHNKVDVMSQLHGDKRLSKRIGNNCFF